MSIVIVYCLNISAGCYISVFNIPGSNALEIIQSNQDIHPVIGYAFGVLYYYRIHSKKSFLPISAIRFSFVSCKAIQKGQMKDINMKITHWKFHVN